MKKFKTLVIGATAIGCAYAVAHNSDILIIEPSMLLCTEFASAYRCDPVPMIDSELLDEFKQRNIVDGDGNISVQPVSGIIGERVLDAKVPLMLMSTILSVKPSDGGYTVEYYSSVDGFGAVECERILDTTVTRGHNPTVTLRCMTETPTDCKGRFDGEYVYKLKVTPDTDWITARKMISELDGVKIATISAFYAYEYASPVCDKLGENYYKIPSASYSDVLTAYEEGLKCVIFG